MTASNATKPSSITYTYHDPSRTFDGTPYEAAQKAVVQTSQVVKLLQRAVADTTIQVRNAHMQRSLDTGGDPDAEGWEDSAQKRLLVGFSNSLNHMYIRLGTLHKAAGYDPKNPPKEAK